MSSTVAHSRPASASAYRWWGKGEGVPLWPNLLGSADAPTTAYAGLRKKVRIADSIRGRGGGVVTEGRCKEGGSVVRGEVGECRIAHVSAGVNRRARMCGDSIHRCQLYVKCEA